MQDIPDYQTLMLPILRMAAEGEMTIPKAVERIAMEFGLTTEQLATLLPSGRFPIINNRAHWAKTYLVKAGLLTQPRRGVFAITDRGRTVLTGKPDKVDNRLLAQFSEFRAFQRRQADPQTAAIVDGPVALGRADAVTLDVVPPSERIASAIKEIEATIRDDLLLRIFAIEPVRTRAEFFERIVVELLVAMGYGGGRTDAAERLGRTGDGGVDGLIKLDKLGIDRVYLQAKCYQPESAIDVGAVRDFSGAFDDKKTTRGVFITTSRFTREARNYVASIQKQIVLIDGEELTRLMVDHNVGVRQDRTIAIKRLDEDFFEAWEE
jgi:restriction system protein